MIQLRIQKNIRRLWQGGKQCQQNPSKSKFCLMYKGFVHERLFNDVIDTS